MQAAHEAEVASLRAAITTAEEHSRNLQSQREAEADERGAAIAELNEEVEQLQTKLTALEANLGECTSTPYPLLQPCSLRGHLKLMLPLVGARHPEGFDSQNKYFPAGKKLPMMNLS